MRKYYTLQVCIVLAELFLAFIAPVPDPYGKIKYLVVISVVRLGFCASIIFFLFFGIIFV